VTVEKLVPIVGEFAEQLLPVFLSPEGKEALKYKNDENVLPSKEPGDIFRAFKYVTPETLHTIIIGQDPYPGKDEKGIPYATGIAFGIRENQKMPKSLQIIDHVLRKCENLSISDPTLRTASRSGVLFLNSALTVPTGKIGAHAEIWRGFLQKALDTIQNKENIAVVRMGKQAQFLKGNFGYVIDCPHPMVDHYDPAGKNFENNQPFTKLHNWLMFMNDKKIEW
jgi:uracil-DNA glycosylase